MDIKTFDQIDSGKFVIPSYKIAWKPKTYEIKKLLSKRDYDQYQRLLFHAQSYPKRVLREVEMFKEKHSSLPQAYNLLSYIYIRLKKLKKAEQLTYENYKANPENFLAKINYADQCIRKNKLDEIPIIFNNQFDLNELFPRKDFFHASEILGFLTMMGFYFLKRKEETIAKNFYKYAKKIDENDKAVLLLKRKLNRKNIFRYLLRK